MQRYFAEIAYDGTSYHGWQYQPNATSIQEKLTTTLAGILNYPDLKIHGCGRTDTGVHASQFFVHFNADLNMSIEKFVFVANQLLKKDIVVKRIFPVGEKDHSRYSATARRYHYYFGVQLSPFDRFYVNYFKTPIDLSKMQEACKVLFEFKDFTSFSRSNTDTKTNDCTIMDAQWFEEDGKIIFTIKANRFLRNMVRAIVGTMLEVGTGKITIEEFREVIIKKDRCAAGKSASGHALFLSEVHYKEGIIPSE
jgi:tRNA pseudouridine38-40 synthase